MFMPICNLSQASPHLAMDAQFNYCIDDINSLSSELGIPWEHAKDVPFTSVILYIGFLRNINTRTVSIPDSKKAKYLAPIVT